MQFSIGNAFEDLIEWLQNNFEPVFDAVSVVISTTTGALEQVLLFPPDAVMVLILAALAWAIASRGVAIFTLIRSSRFKNTKRLPL